MDGIGKKLGVKRHVCVFWEEDEQAARAPLLDKKRGERKREKKKNSRLEFYLVVALVTARRAWLQY